MKELNFSYIDISRNKQKCTFPSRMPNHFTAIGKLQWYHTTYDEHVRKDLIKPLFSLLWQQRLPWNGVAICMEAALQIHGFTWTAGKFTPCTNTHYLFWEKQFNSHWCNSLARCLKFDWTYPRQQGMHITLQE